MRPSTHIPILKALILQRVKATLKVTPILDLSKGAQVDRSVKDNDKKVEEDVS